MRHLLSIFSVVLNIFQEAPHKVGQHEMRHPHSRQFYEEIRTPVMFGRGLPLVNSPTRSNMTSPQQYEWFVIIELTFGWSITIWSSCILNIPHIPLPDTHYELKIDALLKFPRQSSIDGIYPADVRETKWRVEYGTVSALHCNRKAVYPGNMGNCPYSSYVYIGVALLASNCSLTKVVVYHITYTMVWHSGIGILLHVCLYGVVCLLPQLPRITTSL